MLKKCWTFAHGCHWAKTAGYVVMNRTWQCFYNVLPSCTGLCLLSSLHRTGLVQFKLFRFACADGESYWSGPQRRFCALTKKTTRSYDLHAKFEQVQWHSARNPDRGSSLCSGYPSGLVCGTSIFSSFGWSQNVSQVPRDWSFSIGLLRSHMVLVTESRDLVTFVAAAANPGATELHTNEIFSTTQ